MDTGVRVRREPVVLPTYEPAAPDRNPMFLENRVYQGSSGKVYPLPVIDRIAENPTDRSWDAIYLENEFVSLMMLPEIGGRIHAGRDLTNGYDFFYRQHVIKPALVGLAGPWISGGVEFNWPQHHRPSTFMPTDVFIEEGEDGSITVWMSEHEPMNRMKGMHGVCLHPGRSVVEVKVRLYNRTPYTQTFLWWANVAARVHEGFQSFFPPDACAVADHAKRATSTYPLCDDRYYGVDYRTRGIDGVPADELPTQFLPANSGGVGPKYNAADLSWYANIPVPTSYMCLGTKEDFFGGYDAFAKAGLMHVADHHVSPGKKQWTWGNHAFGYAWDRNLTDNDGPYIELMAGVYTDNQPDFSFLAPGETTTFSQFWYPYREIGSAQFANVDVAISLKSEVGSTFIGVASTRRFDRARVVLSQSDLVLREWTVNLSPESPFTAREELDGPATLIVEDSSGLQIGKYTNELGRSPDEVVPATEPPLPADVVSADELYLIGVHLDQYRHATRDPMDYWCEALRRDPKDCRCNNSVGLWYLKRGEFELARTHFARAVARSTQRNPNPYDGEPYYDLGLALRFLGRHEEATDAFAKAVWSAAWQSAGHFALAELACMRSDWNDAIDHLDRCLRTNSDHLKARDLRAYVLQRLNRHHEAVLALSDTLGIDPLDAGARYLLGDERFLDNGIRIDIAIDFMRAGQYSSALDVLKNSNLAVADGSVPMIGYYRAYLSERLGLDTLAALKLAKTSTPDYCFPSRLEDLQILEWATRYDSSDARAWFYLGNLLYDKRRYEPAIRSWKQAAKLEPDNAVAHRNLGIACFNVLHKPKNAKAQYEAAVRFAPDDARLRYERDQLWKRLGVSPQRRLKELASRVDLVLLRDDLTIEYCHLLIDAGQLETADEILCGRKFQPWEGGEGLAIGAFTRTKLALSRKAAERGDAVAARQHLQSALDLPPNLGEARHLLANVSNVWLELGDVCAKLGDKDEAKRLWIRAAEFRGDFQDMSVQAFSELTYFQGLALTRLGLEDEAKRLFTSLRKHARRLRKVKVKIDYFATSLPTMLLFQDDLQARSENLARLLEAQAELGLGRTSVARQLLADALRLDPYLAPAVELLSRLS